MEYEQLLSKYEYAELRVERRFESFINIKDDEIKHSFGSSEGICVRVLREGAWGFASSTYGNKTIENLLNTAEKLAQLSKGKIKLTEPQVGRKKISNKINVVDTETQVKTLLEASKEMKSDKVSSRIISCTDASVGKEFYNSHGTEIIQETGYTYLSCTCIARDGTNIQRGSERSWSRSGFGEVKIFQTATESKDIAIRMLNAAPPPKGRFTIILDPEMTGVFSHEAIGHACEADSVVDRESILAGRIGKKIGNGLVTIIDDPTANDFGQYSYDDEGVEARQTVLLENGVLKSYMNSMETANELGVQLNGHARAESYGVVPIVRMSNTYFQKGGSKVDEVFDIRDGVYLKGMKGGSVDIFSGGFMFKAEEAYEVRNGEKGKLMRDVTISGNILQTLLDVECVGNDFGTSPGICGKFGQEVPVSDGGPHIRIKNVTIG